MATTRYYGTGRRKSSVARVYLVPGTGKVTINKKDMDEYFGYDTLKVIARQPLELTSTADKFDVLVNVHGVNFVYPNYKFQTAATTSQGSNPLGGFFVECALVISCSCRCR